jgi:hypothetical protein
MKRTDELNELLGTVLGTVWSVLLVSEGGWAHGMGMESALSVGSGGEIVVVWGVNYWLDNET